MRYEKPEIKIEKFSIVENIMDDGVSAGSFHPIIDENKDPWFETAGEALGNIFSID